MKLRNYVLLGTTLLISSPAWAGTIYGGFEDTKGGDYDYNDIVFSLSGSSLVLNANGGVYYAKPATLNGANGASIALPHQTGVPFWNNTSSDGPNDNIGFCIYGGPSGSCGGVSALDPTASYLAAPGGNASALGSDNNVTFSVGLHDGVSPTIVVTITSANDALGYYLTADSTHSFHAITSGVAFNPGGDFGLVGTSTSGPSTYYSNTAVGGTQDNVSHFAFFANPVATPEPASMVLFGSGLLGLSFLRRQRRKA